MSTAISNKNKLIKANNKNHKSECSCNKPGKTNFEIHLFMGDKEVTREEMKKYAIRSNTVDRIVNRVVDNAIIIDGEYYFVIPEEAT